MILFISSRNIKILNDYQKAYLVLSIILWLLMSLKYLVKLILLIYVHISKKRFYKPKIEKKAKLVWIISNGCTYLFMLIGLIYDMALIVSGDISSVIYVIIYFLICFIYIICSIFDYNYNYIILKIIFKPLIKKKKISSKPKGDNYSITSATNKENDEINGDRKSVV